MNYPTYDNGKRSNPLWCGVAVAHHKQGVSFSFLFLFTEAFSEQRVMCKKNVKVICSTCSNTDKRDRECASLGVRAFAILHMFVLMCQYELRGGLAAHWSAASTR